MSNKIKNIVVTVCFCLFILFFSIFAVVKPPTKLSESERRPLAQFPESITLESVFDKSSIEQFESYTVDQFPLREVFRTLKAYFHLDVLRIKENNGLAVKNGYIAAIKNDFNDEVIDYSLGRLRYVWETYLKDNKGNKYFALVPDKNYYLAEDYGYPSPDYKGLKNKITDMFTDFEYIDLTDTLCLEAYYKTDTHWSQDKIISAANKLLSSMGVDEVKPESYTLNSINNFKGVYYLQSALYPQPDTLYYLTNDTINSYTVYDYETQNEIPVYSKELFESKDGYNFFLGGTKALLRIDNPKATTDKELIIFRDSFTSSIAPLLAESYKSVYLVDIRYVMPDIVREYIDPADKDVLFMYSSLILNQKSLK